MSAEEQRVAPGDGRTGGPPAGASAGLAVNSATVTCWTMVSRVTGLVRTVAIAAVLGPTYLGNLFQAANLLPNMAYDVLAGTLFASLLVPPLVRHVNLDDAESTEALACRFLGVVTLAFGLVTVVVVALGPLILRALTVGVDDPRAVAGQLRVGWPLLAMLMPQVVLYGVAGTGSAVMNAHGRFALAAAAPAFENLGVIVTMLAMHAFFPSSTSLARLHGPALALLGVGTTGGVALHAAAQWYGARRVGVVLVPRAGWHDPEMRSLIARILPSLGYAALKAARVFVILVVANRVAGGVVAFQLALNFSYFATALTARPVALALLPALSRYHHEGKPERFRDELVRGAALTALFTVPAALSFVVLSVPLARAASVGAMANSAGTVLIAASLASLGPGIVGECGIVLGTHASYARDDARSPLWSMVVSAGLSLPLMLIAFLSSPGTAVLLVLGFALSAGNLAGTWALTRSLRAALPRGSARLFPALLRAFTGSALALVPSYVLVTSLARAFGGGPFANLLGLAAGTVTGGAIFLALQRVGNSPEVALLVDEWDYLRSRSRVPRAPS